MYFVQTRWCLLDACFMKELQDSELRISVNDEFGLLCSWLLAQSQLATTDRHRPLNISKAQELIFGSNLLLRVSPFFSRKMAAIGRLISLPTYNLC